MGRDQAKGFMTGRNDIVAWAVMGVAGGSIGAAIMMLLRLQVSGEAVFSLVGAIIGAAGTVAGAIWLNDRNAALANYAEVSLLAEEADKLLTETSKAIGLHSSTFPRNAEFQPTLVKINELSAEARAVFAEALSRGVTLNFRQRVKLIKAEAAIRVFTDFFWFCFGEMPDDPSDERNWPDTLGYLKECLTGLRTELGAK